MKTKIFSVFLSISIVVCYSLTYAQLPRADRPPAVAGQFYPADKKELTNTLTQLFHNAKSSLNVKNIAALIVPHAGYEYSGEVAASAYNQIDPLSNYENVFLVGSSHHVAFNGASIYRKGNFITPLGAVPVNIALADELIKKHSFFNDRNDAHEKEHSLEVQLPFLQYRLKKQFQIVPIILGGDSPELCKNIAGVLRQYFTSKNLFIISTDFSHYPDYDNAMKIDQISGIAVRTNSVSKLVAALQSNAKEGIPNVVTSMCGWTSVMTFLFITQEDTSLKFREIVYKNSGDTPVGDKTRVVGYHSILIHRPVAAAKPQFILNDKEKKDLLTFARRTIKEYLTSGNVAEVDTGKLSSSLKKKCGAFVTLNKNHSLRGCIGRFNPDEPLYQVVQDMAIAAATQDSRFAPVQQQDLDGLSIEISVLTPMRKVASIDEIELGKHGIYILKGDRGGTFLPQVATETGWTKEEFLGHCSQDKAGLGWDGWRNAEIYIYEALVFGED